ncbi:MAG: tetratricopeptide repeat protein [Desulfobacterales bacterium]|nr:tetratricopeptide repeat protein [Desulfobacterales bacterium]
MESAIKHPRFRYGACALVMLPALIAGAFLLPRLYAELHYLQGERRMRAEDYGTAAAHFNKALRFLPNDPSIWKRLGSARRGLSGRETIREAFKWEKKAKEALLEAARLNPLDYEAFLNLAMVEQSLERLALFATADQIHETFDADPYFREAIRLKPNSPVVQFTWIRRLYFNGKTDELLRAVERLVRVHPASVKSLKKELFWSPSLAEEAKKGLAGAIAEGTSPWFANKALSEILAEEGEWAGAITCFQRALSYKHMPVTGRDYFKLGRLHLEHGRHPGAMDYFVQGLAASRRPGEYLESLYRLYTARDAPEEFDDFLTRIRQSFTFTNKTEILYARTLIDQNRFNRARRVLNTLNENHPSPEAFYWLARAAEKEKDWGAMEAAMREAVRLDSGNRRYHRVFAGVLRRQGKTEKAEKHDKLAKQLAEGKERR